MKTKLSSIIIIGALFGTINAWAGTTLCHAPVISKRPVVSNTSVRFIAVSAIHRDTGCASSLEVIVKFKSQSMVNWTQFRYMVIREQQNPKSLIPVLLDSARFKVLGPNTISINDQLFLGDKLFIRIPTFPVFSFEIL